MWAARIGAAAVVAASVAAAPASAADDDALFDSGRLLATGGVSQLEGAGGGGLAPWAVITGYGTENAVGINGHYTFVGLPDFLLHTGGLAVGLFDRLELSYAYQAFDTRGTGAKLGLGKGYTFHQHVFGAKLRLIGDAIYDQDRWWPQLALGIQYKSNDRGDVIRLVGGKDDDGIDFYLAATKLILSESLLLNATVRATKANQFGILGFGGDRNDDYRPQFEGSAALLVSRNLALGVEYRMKPNNLSFADEDDAADVFVAWFLNKHVSATLAFVALGDIATERDQNGLYFSLQVGL